MWISILYHSLSELPHDLDHTTQYLIFLDGTSSSFPVDSVSCNYCN